MTTLIVSPILAFILASATQSVAVRAPAAPNVGPARVEGSIKLLGVSELRQAQTDTPSPPPVAAAPVAPVVVPAAPVAVPAATPRAAVRPPVGAGPPANPNSVIGIIEAAAAHWGVSGSWMVSIARCESGLRPNADNPRGPYLGLFQFLQSTFTANGGTNIFDAADQANVAAKMLAHGQAHQWSCA